MGVWHKELLNVHKPLPLDIPIFLDNEKNMGEWSADRVVKTSVFLIDPCKLFETRK